MEQLLQLGCLMQIDNITILVAEDEDELREYLVEYLQIFFKTVYSAACGKEAYKIYQDSKPDIILSDINMPNLDGLSMISRIRLNDEKTKIIIMSAHSDTEKLLQAIKLNLVTYLVKPIKVEELKELLFKLVDEIKNSSTKLFFNNNTYWDKSSNSLYCNNVKIDLKNKESMLIQILCSKANHPLSSEDIFKILFKDKEYSSYSITSLVKRLRAKIPTDIIQNEYGTGYKIVPIK